MTSIYLIRHGQTAWNLEKRFQGQADIPLNEDGKAQAAAVAAWLDNRDVTFDTIYTSDLERARETAQIIGQHLGVTPRIEHNLRELNCGSWEGLQADDIRRDFPGQLEAWRDAVDTYTIPQGECVIDVQKRVWSFYESLEQPDQTVMIVAHGVTLLSLVCKMLGWNLNQSWNDRDRRFDNTSVTIIDYDASTDQHTLRLFNSTAHLDQEKA